MENNNSSAGSGQHGNFFGGFLLGVFVGGALVFLLGTEKGKRILKAISEGELDNISNILKKADEKVSINAKTMPDKTEEEKRELTPRRFVAREKFIGERPKARRFFRGISRHLN